MVETTPTSDPRCRQQLRAGNCWTWKFRAFFLFQIIPQFSAFGADSLPSFNDPCGLQPCLADMTEVVNNFGFPAGFDEQLATICRKLSESLRCIDEKFLGCVSTTAAKRRAALELKNAADFLRDLCNDSDFHRDYLRHAQCFNNVTNQNSPTGCWYFTSTIVVHYRKLAETFHPDSVQQWGSPHARNEAAKMYMHAICCAHSEFMPCAYRASYHACGPHAAQFAFNYMWRMTSPVFQETCHHLKRWRSCDSKASLYKSMLSSSACRPTAGMVNIKKMVQEAIEADWEQEMSYLVKYVLKPMSFTMLAFLVCTLVYHLLVTIIGALLRAANKPMGESSRDKIIKDEENQQDNDDEAMMQTQDPFIVYRRLLVDMGYQKEDIPSYPPSI